MTSSGKNRKRRGSLIAILFMAIFMAAVCPGREKVSQAKILSHGSENYEYTKYRAGDLKVSVHVGLVDNFVKPGRYIPAVVEIQNEGKDFSGSFCLYQNLQNHYANPDRMICQKKVQIAAGETKQYSMMVKIICGAVYDGQGMQTAVMNDKKKVLGHKFINFASTDNVSSSYTTVGFMTQDSTGLAYMNSNQKSCMLFDVQDWMVTEDYRSLDIFDILVINDFDTGQFSEKQIAAILEWVEQGGTLILGTGAQPEKTLKAFSSTLLRGSIGDVKKIPTSYGVTLDCSEIQLEQAETLLAEKEDILVSKVAYGKGCAMVAAFDLNVGQEQLGIELGELFYQNISEDRKRQLAEEEEEASNYSGYYAISEGLSATEVDSLPNVYLYAALLLLYALLIGPLLYSFLRKRGKREYLWGLIPALAVVFSVLIYLIGTSTRVKHPYINYLSGIDLSDSEQAEVETYFNLITPNNDRFDMEISGKADLAPYIPGNYYGYDNSTDNTDYQYGMEYLADKTKLHMDNMAAFDTVPFEEKQKEKEQGQLSFSDIKPDKKNPAGIVTNNTGYDLEDCILVCTSDVVSLGDIKQGESVSLDKLKKSSWHDINDIYNTLHDYSFDYRGDCQGLRRMSLLSYYNRDLVGYCFYGFLPEGQDTVFTKQFDLDLYGETVVRQQLEQEAVDSSVGYQVGILHQYIEELPDGVDGSGIITDPQLKEIRASYDLSGQGPRKNLQLHYQQQNNPEFEPADMDYEESAFFYGTVSAVNQKTGEAELLFTSGEEALIEDLTPYLGQNGKLTLIYQLDEPDDYYEEYHLPNLILERRNAE